MTPTKKLRKAALGACAAVLALLASACVSGPLPVLPADPTLTNRGYIQREYFLDGKADAYGPVGALGSDGHWTVQPVSKAAYRTRLLVKRPADAAKFNGTVLVEWLNVSSGFDVDVTFGAAIDELLRDGYAYVGVSVQKIGVDGLAGGDTSRYGSLFHPGDEYSYDIFTQAGRAVRGTIGEDPLGGLEPERLLAAGESQSAFRMVTYINAVNPLAHAFDGFFVYSRGSNAASLGAGTTLPANALMRTDQPEPILDVQTEGDIVVLRSHLARQDDNSKFRLWEVAGGAHADEHTLSRKNPPNATAPGSPCEFRANSVATFAVVSAAVSGLDHWVATGIAPRRAARITLGNDVSVADPVVRDQFGNALGGIRMAELEAPIARIDGLPNPAPAGAPPLFQGFCRLFGRTLPFTDAQLAQLYPTHQDYVDAFNAAIDRLVARGFVLREDATPMKLAAAAAPVP